MEAEYLLRERLAGTHEIPHSKELPWLSAAPRGPAIGNPGHGLPDLGRTECLSFTTCLLRLKLGDCPAAKAGGARFGLGAGDTGAGRAGDRAYLRGLTCLD